MDIKHYSPASVPGALGIPSPIATPGSTGVDAKMLRARLDAARNGHADEAETARKFEAVLATQLVKQMRSSLQKGFFGEGAAGDIYSGWLDESIGKSLAGRDALHLQAMVLASLKHADATKGTQP
jgi:Rod binding domain-containing protein